VLSDDFLTVADDALPNIRALMTMVGGKIVHEAGL
jgi:predicted amidohydrolase YtcJ